jgi:hypothetical protein
VALSTSSTEAALALVGQLDALSSLIEKSDQAKWAGALMTLRDVVNRELTAANLKSRLAPPAPVPVYPVARPTRIGY